MTDESRLEEELRKSGGRMTRQLRVLLDTLGSVDTHPTAAELYEMVREQLPDVSQGTVYRNLRSLQKLGYVQELDYGAGASHYDATVEPHYHLRCSGCSQVVDLHIERQPSPGLERAQQAAPGWHVSQHRVEFLGLCPECHDSETGNDQEGS